MLEESSKVASQAVAARMRMSDLSDQYLHEVKSSSRIDQLFVLLMD